MQIRRLLVPTLSSRGNTGETHHISYTDWGDPDNPHVVMCVHGLTRNCRDFDYLAGALKADCRVICADIVGRGQSDWIKNAADYDYYPVYLSDAALLLAHIQSQYKTSIILDWVGISLGGLIGMVLAIQPEHSIPIHKLIMSDIGPFIPASALSRMSDYVGKDLRFDNFEVFKAYMKKISTSFGPLTDDQWHHLAIHSVRKYNNGTVGFCYDPKISISFKEHVLKDIDLWEQWDQLAVPTLVLRGTESDVLLAETAVTMQARGTKAEIIELSGIGHAPILMDRKQIAIVKNSLLPK
tara:strand:+ start:2262 stop:3149 length:888 start_codon:yes stop_codon:yes gene_type:complete